MPGRTPRESPPAAPARAAAEPPFIRALLRPDAYPHPAGDLQLCETHASWVLLAGDYAYKIKKPVDFGFLDYSTRERRAADCAEEVRLNRRLSPDVYLGVVDIVEREGTYAVGGSGTPVEPAVRMRRLPADGMLSSLLARRAVDTRLVRRIAHRLARFHARAATGPGVDEFGAAAAVRANWDENFCQTNAFVGRTLPAALRDVIRGYVASFLSEQAPLLARRVAAGRIRDGHGDLHADSICVENGRIHLFDCLQFAPRYRCADVAAEVAFLAMDLDHNGRADLAAGFIDAYVDASGDAELRALLPFYACYRAFVRGKVRSLRLDQPDLSPSQAAAVAAEARAYFDLAWAYAGGLGGPLLAVTMGRYAPERTALARALACRLGLVHLSVNEPEAGPDEIPAAPSLSLTAASQIRGAESLPSQPALQRRAGWWLRRGRSVVLDATFDRTEDRAALGRLAARAGARWVVLHVGARSDARDQGAEGGTGTYAAADPASGGESSGAGEIPHAVMLDASTPVADAVERALAVLQARE